VPSLPESVPTPTGPANRLGVNVDQFTRFGAVDKAAYTLVFFHTALVQAVCSGFIAGQLGNGSLRDGAKHAGAMLAVAYLVFVLISSPVASIAAGSALSTGESVNVASVSTSDGGFLVVRDGNVNGTVLGRTAYIEPGTQRNVLVPLDEPLERSQDLHITAHRDTDGDRVYDFEGPYLPNRKQTDRPYSGLASDSTPGVEVTVNVTG
jgi:flagellar protein FlaJ